MNITEYKNKSASMLSSVHTVCDRTLSLRPAVVPVFPAAYSGLQSQNLLQI